MTTKPIDNPFNPFTRTTFVICAVTLLHILLSTTWSGTRGFEILFPFSLAMSSVWLLYLGITPKLVW